MTGWFKLITERWSRFWFSAGSPYDLAGARIVMSVYTLWLLLSRDLPAMSGLPEDFWARVPVWTQWRYLVFHGHPLLEQAIQGVAVAALVAAAVGILPRVSCLTAALLVYHLAPLESILSTGEPASRGFGVAILSLTVLGFSPCGDVMRLARHPPTAELHRLTWEYSWPLRLMQIFVVHVYFFSGYAKMYESGIAWISAANIRSLLLLTSQRSTVAFASIGPSLADRPTLLFMMAFGTVLFELTFPFVLFWRASRRVFIPCAFAIHAGILLSMNIVYPGVPQLLIFVNWDWVQTQVRRTDKPARRHPAGRR